MSYGEVNKTREENVNVLTTQKKKGKKQKQINVRRGNIWTENRPSVPKNPDPIFKFIVVYFILIFLMKHVRNHKIFNNTVFLENFVFKFINFYFLLIV